ncbi:TonB-dependent receptor plug domain-containing protein [Yunchengibacter salinarum]|uniref:TonB-dependent receptor plug domain-containing protein n=1 Tax=Yunchengibacter salinarum TaxID=3133399 RepID=UPI0035B68D23
MTRETGRIVSGCVAALMVSAPSFGQAVDYEAMRSLFGEPVTVSANGKPQRQSDVPLSMEIITREDIARSGAQDIPQILRRYAGMSVREYAKQGSEVAIRGFNQPLSERLLVLLNGRQVYLDLFGQVIWELIPVEIGEIQQIEVVRGPNTALFGFNAVSGVINIVTNNPLYNERTDVNVTAGTQDQLSASLSSSFKLGDRLGVRLSAGAFGADEFDQGRLLPFNQDVLQTKPRRSQVSGELFYQLSDNVQLGFDGSYSSINRNGFSPIRVDARIEADFYTLRGRLIADTDWGLINLNAYHNGLDPVFGQPNPATGGLNRFSPQSNTNVLQLSNIFQPAMGHTIRLFGEYRDNDLQILSGDKTFALDGGGDVKYEIASVSALWDWKISQALSLSTTVRYDDLSLSRSGGLPAGFPLTNADFDTGFDALAFNAGLVWKPSEADTIRLTAARGIDIPSLTEFGFVLPAGQSPFGGAVFIGGDPNTDFSRVMNYEVNYDRRIAPLSSTLKLAAFFQDINNMQSFNARTVVAPPHIVLFQGNVGDSEAYGLEATLEGSSGAFRWNINYTLMDISSDIPLNDGGVFRTPVLPAEEVSNHTVNVDLGADFGRFSADTLVQYTSGYTTTRNFFTTPPGTFTTFDVPDNLRVDLRLAYRANDAVTVELVGQALDEQAFLETPLAPVGRQVFLRVGAAF